jgi:hypothetical protein
MRTHLAALALTAAAPLATPSAALALTVTLDEPLIGRAECLDQGSEEVSLSWDLGTSSGTSVELLASDTSGCSEGDDDATTAVLVDGLSTGQTSYPLNGDDAVTVSDLLSGAGLEAGTCDGDDLRVYLCVRLLDSSGAEVSTGSAALKVELERPPPPVILTVSAGENGLHVAWEEGDAVEGATASSETFEVFASAAGATVGSGETSGTSLRLGGLENGTTYDVWVVAYSEAGNASDASELAAGTPLPVNDFYEEYQAQGGAERGGCSQGGAGGLLSSVVVLALRRRRSGAGRAAAPIALLGAAVLGCSGARPPDAPPPGAISPQLPRSSIAAVLARRGELELTPGQVEALEAADRELAARLYTLRVQLRSAGRPAGKPGRADGAREGGSGGMEGPMGGGPGGGGGPMRGGGGPPGGAEGAPGGNGARPREDPEERRRALAAQLDDEDTRAYLRAEALLDPGQREPARAAAERYRAARYEAGEPERKRGR